ncbi:hypothetical protein BDF21DRAFT_405971 [Thamnidium elegans]|nr:hypothetical protein BDF21DRAFT_405971 [Thamnidium elegans]
MDQYSQDFNMGSSGSLPSFSIPNASTQASSFNSYQTPYNSSEYVHVSRIEEILTVLLNVLNVLLKSTPIVYLLLRVKLPMPLPLWIYLLLLTLSLQKVRSSLDKIFSSDCCIYVIYVTISN